MLIQQKLTTFLKIHLKLQQFYGTVPISVCPSSSTNKLIVLNIRGKLNYELFKTILLSFYTFVLWVQLLTEGKDVELVKTFESLLFATGATTMCVAKWLIFLRREDLVELYNMFLEFEKYHFKSK